jgi:uncharacterized integral membrane protein (TIGR00698 family)
MAATGGTFLFTMWFGKLIGVEPRLTELIAAGTSICGASAIVATNAVTAAHDEDVAYAIASITIFGSIAIFLYPFLALFIGLGARDYGLWTGSSIHEVAQVVAAAFQGGQEAGQIGTVAKLTRVMMLAPLVLAIGIMTSRRLRAATSQPAASTPVPLFVFGFAAMVAINSNFDAADRVKAWLAFVTTFLLTLALAAMGLTTDVRKLRLRGFRPLLLGLAAAIFISGFSLLLIEAST